MNKLVYLFLIISSISVKAQDTLTLEGFIKMFQSQSEVCLTINAGGITSYCVLHAESKYFNPLPFPYCGVPLLPELLSNDEVNTFIGKVNLACPTPANFQEDWEKAETGSKRKALLTTVHRCTQPVLAKAVEEYGCHTFDYSQIFELLMSNQCPKQGSDLFLIVTASECKERLLKECSEENNCNKQ